MKRRLYLNHVTYYLDYEGSALDITDDDIEHAAAVLIASRDRQAARDNLILRAAQGLS